MGYFLGAGTRCLVFSVALRGSAGFTLHVHPFSLVICFSDFLSQFLNLRHIHTFSHTPILISRANSLSAPHSHHYHLPRYGNGSRRLHTRVTGILMLSSATFTPLQLRARRGGRGHIDLEQSQLSVSLVAAYQQHIGTEDVNESLCESCRGMWDHR
jgi:hypothetical protein